MAISAKSSARRVAATGSARRRGRLRIKLLVVCGRREQAIEEARARPEPDSWYEARNLAKLLADAGRPEEAVAIMAQAIPADRTALAAHLMTAGRIKEAVALFREPAASRT